MAQEKLKPCPFCGGFAVVEREGPLWVAGCDSSNSCPALNPHTDYCNTESEATELWNYRSVDVPKAPITKEWNPNRCPSCGADIGGECDDGYYDNPHYTRCPECGQKLKWEDTSY